MVGIRRNNKYHCTWKTMKHFRVVCYSKLLTKAEPYRRSWTLRVGFLCWQAEFVGSSPPLAGIACPSSSCARVMGFISSFLVLKIFRKEFQRVLQEFYYLTNIWGRERRLRNLHYTLASIKNSYITADFSMPLHAGELTRPSQFAVPWSFL